jgi:hypothetical protein
VSRARAGEDFAVLAAGLVDACAWVDPERVDWTAWTSAFYKIGVEDSQGRTGQSEPVRAVAEWTRRDYLTAREILRREWQRARMCGSRGLLYKKRLWGAKCPRCADWDVRGPADEQCKVCYGTGLRGGYHPPTPLPAVAEQLQTGTTEQYGDGAFQMDARQFRCVYYPAPRPGDLWVEAATGVRWVLQEGISFPALVKGVPLVAVCPARALPQTDVTAAPGLAELSEPSAPMGPAPNSKWVENLNCLDN